LGVLEPLITKFTIPKAHVSIPVRVLGVLERERCNHPGHTWDVSIPVRVLGVLEPSINKKSWKQVQGFQSL